MDTRPTAAEGRFELEEKYRHWKETYLPDGNLSCVWPILDRLQTLGDERLKAAHDAAVAGLFAEKLLAHVKPISNFHFVAGLTTGLLIKRGLLSLRYMEDEANDRGLNHEYAS